MIAATPYSPMPIARASSYSALSTMSLPSASTHPKCSPKPFSVAYSARDSLPSLSVSKVFSAASNGSIHGSLVPSVATMTMSPCATAVPMAPCDESGIHQRGSPVARV